MIAVPIKLQRSLKNRAANPAPHKEGLPDRSSCSSHCCPPAAQIQVLCWAYPRATPELHWWLRDFRLAHPQCDTSQQTVRSKTKFKGAI